MTKPGEPIQHVPVFVGSTYEDLQEYRNAVRDSLHQLETIVRGMEYFGSKPGTPKEECLKAVQSCKVYIGIFAMRYGSIDEETGKSMTHIEYDEAQRLGLPTLIYLIDEQNQRVFPKFVDTGDKAKLLYNLKNKLKRKYMVSFFTTPDDLAKRISQDLPPVLEHIGIMIERKPEELEQPNAKEILTRFMARPAKYAGYEITVRCIIIGEVKRVYEDDCTSLRLPLGDSIERRVKSDELNSLSKIIATKENADWLEEISEGSDVTVRIKLLYGTTTDIEYSEDGPIGHPRIVTGYQVTETNISNIDPNANTDK